MEICIIDLKKRLLEIADVSKVVFPDPDDRHICASLVGTAAALQDAHARLKRALGHSITCVEYGRSP